MAGTLARRRLVLPPPLAGALTRVFAVLSVGCRGHCEYTTWGCCPEADRSHVCRDGHQLVSDLNWGVVPGPQESTGVQPHHNCDSCVI